MMRKILIGTAAGVVCLWGGYTAVATEPLADDMAGAISVNCASIITQLQSVRYFDRRAREYLGNRYEKAFTGFVTSLNVRLVKNNISNVPMQELQLTIAEAHAGFKYEYGRYATEMNVLIGMDCVNKPGEFYAKLVQVREYRAKVMKMVKEMNKGLDDYRAVVAEMRDLL